jgi:hypothetical protein
MPAGNLWEQLKQFQQVVSQIQKRAPNPRDRQALGELLEQIKTSQAQAETDLPKVLAHLRQHAANYKAQAEAAQQEIAQAIQKAEALHQQAAQREQLAKQPPARPAAAIDPHLGKQLQAELLDKLDQLGAARDRSAAVEQREAWQDWQGFESRRRDESKTPGKPAPPAAAPLAPPQGPAPLPTPPAATAAAASASDDAAVWSGLSRIDQSVRKPRDTHHPGQSAPQEVTPEDEKKAEPPPAAHRPTEPQPAPPAKHRHKPKKSKTDDNDDDIWKGLSKLDE